MEFFEFTERLYSDWNDYVQRNNSASFAHQIEWKTILEKSFKHKPIYLLAKAQYQIVGILPLFYYSILLFGCPPLMKKLKSFRFMRREEDSRILVYLNKNSPHADYILNSSNWLLLEGDRDI